MPACLTHSCFAQVVKDQKGDVFAIDPCAYAWGAQGPDFFFCHRLLPFQKGESLQAYGNRLHEELPSKVLGALRDFLRKHSGKVYRSYVEGFVCHYALDSTAHPYINWKARELVRRFPWETPDTLHGEIEAALDAIVLRYETGKLPSEVRLKDMFPKNEAVQRQIAHLYREVLFAMYGESVSEKLLYQATQDAHGIFALLQDRSGLKKRVVALWEKGRPHAISSHFVPLTEREDVDFANVGQEPWGSGPERSQQDFFALYKEAQERACVILAGFDQGDLSRLTEEKPFG